MIQPDVYVNGVPLAHYGTVQVDFDSTILRSDDWSGCFQAQGTVNLPAGFSAPWWHANAEYVHELGGARTFGGRMSEPRDNGDGTWTFAANGYGSLASGFQAFEADLSAPLGCAQEKATKNADAALDFALTTYGASVFPLNRYGTTFGIAAGADPTDNGTSFTIADLLTLVCKGQGVSWWVDAWGGLTTRTPDTAAKFVVTPGTFGTGTADDNYFSEIHGYFVYRATTPAVVGGGGPAQPVPNQWQWVVARDQDAERKFGHRETRVNLTDLGLMSFAAAQAQIDARLAAWGGRMGWTDQVALTEQNAWRAGFGPASPFTVTAGQVLMDPSVVDTQSSPSVAPACLLTGREVQRRYAEGRVVVTPVGFAPRDDSALSAPVSTVLDSDVAA